MKLSNLGFYFNLINTIYSSHQGMLSKNKYIKKIEKNIKKMKPTHEKNWNLETGTNIIAYMSGKSGVITNCPSTFPAIQPSL